MRQKNWRFILAGGLLAVFGAGFFLFMLSMAHQSNDPKSMLQTVGEASGVCIGIGVVLVIAGLFGKKFPI
jgi:uncharacterized membrane protein HdeD (DUF308 family)